MKTQIKYILIVLTIVKIYYQLNAINRWMDKMSRICTQCNWFQHLKMTCFLKHTHAHVHTCAHIHSHICIYKPIQKKGNYWVLKHGTHCLLELKTLFCAKLHISICIKCKFIWILQKYLKVRKVRSLRCLTQCQNHN